MDGKAFAWQRHYIQNINNKEKSWKQILKDIGSRFDYGAIDDPIIDLARLKQKGTLLDILKGLTHYCCCYGRIKGRQK